MARPLRVQFPGALYHVTNRGNERKAIFKDDDDRREFLKILSQSIDTYGIVLHAFVLMNNHWHLLAQTPLANLGEFMRHFNITYTSHYNRHHNRVGHLYQGRYKSFLVDEDAYLSQVSRYIHLNPVQVSSLKNVSQDKRLQALWKYKWSSLPGYVSKTGKFDFVMYDQVLADYGGDNLSGRMSYKRQLEEDLSDGLDIRKKIVGQSILGDESFVSWVRHTFIDGKDDRERPDVRKIHSYLSQEDVIKIVEEETGTTDILLSTGITRQIIMTILYKYVGLNNREIGNLLGVDYSTVSQGRKRLLNKLAGDNELDQLIERIEKRLSLVAPASLR